MEIKSDIMTNCKNTESVSKCGIRKDIEYSTESNDCGSNQEISSCQGDIMPAYIDINDNLTMLKMELDKTKLELEQKSLECEKLENIRNKVEAEIEDLTASLFEEANKMVYDANLKQHKAEKKLAAAEGKIDALEIEVGALKALMITCTPSNPSPTTYRRSTNTPKSSPVRMNMRKNQIVYEKVEVDSSKDKSKEFTTVRENNLPLFHLQLQNSINKSFFHELSSWHQTFLNATKPLTHASTSFCNCQSISEDEDRLCAPLSDCEMIKKSPFMSRILHEDISLCLSFNNEELSRKVSHCIHGNSLSVELATTGGPPTQFCALLETAAECSHRIRLADGETWLPISQSTRNRITTVCDFFTYLRYIKQGIVKHSAEQVYQRIMNHRLEMTLARLGYHREQL